ncbi:acetyl esterase/lipase [Salinibacterium amurskyense]|uniref:Acetyl esterase/lipase n=1 Tax=Salinibacterium amurskyense TaxID=205941 RepID=A0A2M9D8E8_9MICO|nr:alpha/beta hydrolase [Salinibacterium amurskyense]PJJ82004.1 acetyl esterase/lipase [Salinibacterium amurskyense]RLQ81790.1 alpha/beta hydrolase [Salinibacterium amurskyense]GHD78498.1 lipase [Salinibacterium amurskyense]
MSRTAERRPWIRRRSSTIGLSALALGLIATLVWTLSPWPATLLIRALFDKDAVSTIEEMERHATDVPLTESLDEQYGDSATTNSLDVYSPAGSSGPLTTVVWTHGGAWISGDKSNVTPYARNLAAEGFTVVALNYTVSPEATYPTALNEINDALAYLIEHADRLRIDPDNIVFAGDSAGAQLSAQLATVVTNPAYAATVGITPALSTDQLKGVILNCGIYDVSGIPNAPGLGGWGFRVALWGYIGVKDWSNTPGGEQMSVLDDVTAAFPRTWISGGNADPLTASQSEPFAAQLAELGVDTTPLFYPEDHTEQLPHEYQFHLDFEDARAAFDSTVTFLNSIDE